MANYVTVHTFPLSNTPAIAFAFVFVFVFVFDFRVPRPGVLWKL